MGSETTTDKTGPAFKPCDLKRYDEMLEVLPPLEWVRKGFLVGEPWSHRACVITGKVLPTYQAMVCQSALNGRYFESTSGLTVPEWDALDPISLTFARQGA